MSKAIVIEVSGETAGIIVGSTGNFRFFSSQSAFDTLDGKTFRSVEHASRTVSAHLTQQSQRRAA